MVSLSLESKVSVSICSRQSNKFNIAPKTSTNQIRAKLNARQNKLSSQKKNKQQKSMKKMTNNMSRITMVDVPVSRASLVQLGSPKIMNGANGSIRVNHMEQIGPVTGSINYANQTFLVQPGNVNCFPWLYNLALLYESYTINRLEFIFVSAKSSATNGQIYMAMDYDAYDAAPANSQVLSTYQGYVTGQPWLNLTYKCSVANLQKLKVKYTRPLGSFQGDQKTYDAGTFIFATEMCADLTALGKLYVSYDISLTTPQYDLTTYALQGSNYTKSATTGLTIAKPFGDTVTQAGGMILTYTAATNNFTVPVAGQYIVIVGVAGTGLTGLSLASSGQSVLTNRTEYSTLSTGYVVTYSINTVNPGDGFTLTVTASSGSVTGGSVRLASYPTTIG